MVFRVSFSLNLDQGLPLPSGDWMRLGYEISNSWLRSYSWARHFSLTVTLTTQGALGISIFQLEWIFFSYVCCSHICFRLISQLGDIHYDIWLIAGYFNPSPQASLCARSFSHSDWHYPESSNWFLFYFVQQHRPLHSSGWAQMLRFLFKQGIGW